MEKDFLSLVEDNHNNFVEATTSIESLIDSITFYESIIPEFFSKDGKADGIKNMYNSIKKEIGMNEKTIECVDVNKTAGIYKEYIEGMTEFIHDINKLDDVSEISSFEEKFERAMTNDKIFVNTLYENSNEDTTSETVLSEAVYNVEFLIDFIPQMNEMKENCKMLSESFHNDSETQKKLIDSSLVMLYESIDNYCYTTIKNIFKTYDDINTALFSESVSPNENESMFKLL